MSGDGVTESRQETAEDYLRAAAEQLRASTSLNLAVADWLDSTVWQCDPQRSERMRLSLSAGLAVPPEVGPALVAAAAVLGREWVPS